MADAALRDRLIEVLRGADGPMTIGQIASALGVSRPTAAKYVDICEAAKLVNSTWFATARQISLRGGASRKKAAGGDAR